MIYWQSQSADFSLTPTAVMMAMYRLCFVCVLLCIVYAVICVKIKGTIEEYSDKPPAEVEVSEYINGHNWRNTQNFYLDQLLEGNFLPTLTLINFEHLNMLKIRNIPLENTPVFENITSRYLFVTGTSIKFIPTNAFNGAVVKILHLENNEIESMSNGAINKEVGEVYLRCNKLSNFSQTWFKDPSSVGVLNLIGNQIGHIQDQAFSQMTHLLTLDLSYNHITRIGKEAFNSKIQHLYLQFCDIEQLTADMFEARNNFFIHHLHLHNNQLSFLTEALLVKVKPNHITIDGNPWQCQCLRDVEKWIREQHIIRDYTSTSSDEPMCVVPRNFGDMCVPMVDKELQQTYAQGRLPVQGCLPTPCSPCV